MELIKYEEEAIVKLCYQVGNYIIKIEIFLTAKVYNVLKKYQNKNGKSSYVSVEHRNIVIMYKVLV